MPKPHSRKRLIALVILILAVGALRAVAASDGHHQGPKIVMIIRHAEKPKDAGKEDPNLSKRGYDRAHALAKIIPKHFPKPDFLIATKPSKSSDRPAETITPLAKALHEEIEAPFKDDEFEQLAHAVLTDRKYAGKTVLIAWHHGTIPKLAKALGVKDAPDKWNPTVFDRVWEITYDHKAATWKDLPQHALPGDSEK
jgi:phosphohistidine phosphatase SixA